MNKKIQGRIENFVAKEVTHHRNGIGGEGFDIVLFTCNDEVTGKADCPMVCFTFDNGGPQTAIVRLESLAGQRIDMYRDDAAYRGADYFGEQIRKAIEHKDKQRMQEFKERHCKKGE